MERIYALRAGSAMKIARMATAMNIGSSTRPTLHLMDGVPRDLRTPTGHQCPKRPESPQIGPYLNRSHCPFCLGAAKVRHFRRDDYESAALTSCATGPQGQMRPGRQFAWPPPRVNASCERNFARAALLS